MMFYAVATVISMYISHVGGVQLDLRLVFAFIGVSEEVKYRLCKNDGNSEAH